MKQKPIVISGPTASGKTALALEIAQKFGAVIINADSQQVYREIPILSAQPTAKEKQLVPHFMFGEIAGNEEFNVAIWLEKVSKLIQANHRSVIVGGTGMYLNTLFNGLSTIPKIPEEIRKEARALTKEQLLKRLGENGDGNTNRMRRNLEVKLATGKYINEFHAADKTHLYTPENFVMFHVKQFMII